ncbi:hypothetical protein D9758_013638 [Tetrapyrgos nigripes]|uniref:Uncharacterized protein n=1 Tax=Tetrapyrgos nigripes TaxID=182062 RepID=A0A8H5FQY6_9AGAR|nr:hypothetical protein D9758_013638 [Tetrapyrgos nigripes]
MFFNKLFFAILPFFLAGSQAQLVPNAARASNLHPVSIVGDATAVANELNHGTRIYYQPPGGGISQICTNEAFAAGGDTTCDASVVPSQYVLPGTPIVATTALTNGGAFDEIHVFFLSPDYILSEWRWTSAGGPRFGDGCPNCVTHSAFGAVNGSEVLYAIQSSRPATKLRVGFVSVASPTTITEATWNFNTNVWSLAVLPDM